MGSYALTRAVADIAKQQACRNDRQPDWPQIWFSKLCQFHRQPNDPSWNFSADDVIAFLKKRVEYGHPAWNVSKWQKP